MIPRPERQDVRWSERGSTELYKGRTRCVTARTPPEVLLTLSRYRRAPRPLPKDGVSSKDLLKASPERSYCPLTNCVGIRPASLSLTIITLGHNVLCTAPNYPSFWSECPEVTGGHWAPVPSCESIEMCVFLSVCVREREWETNNNVNWDQL